jgi:hypothetical protein
MAKIITNTCGRVRVEVYASRFQSDSISTLLIHEIRTMESFEKLLIAFCILAKPDSLTDPEADRLSGSRITRQHNKCHLVVSGAAHTTFWVAQFFKFYHLFPSLACIARSSNPPPREDTHLRKFGRERNAQQLVNDLQDSLNALVGWSLHFPV